VRYARLVARVAIDQAIFAPVFLLAFFALGAALEGAGAAGLRARLASGYARALGLNYCIWPAATLVNFALIPQELRILFANIVALGWTTLLISVSS
jgi:protein Mpv17